VDCHSIIVRVDGSNEVGAGHLFRSLSFASFLKQKKITTIFATKTKEVFEITSKNNFNCILLKSKDEVKQLYELALLHATNTIIVDLNIDITFSAFEQYQKYINRLKKKFSCVVSYGDYDGRPIDSHIVIIPYLGADQIKMETSAAKYLLGEKYFILREEFRQKINYSVKRKVKNILVTMGGSDPNKITLKAVKAICDTSLKVRVTVLIGAFCKVSNRQVFSLLNGNCQVIRGETNISEYMQKCDMAITNSGLTKYELSGIGVPHLVLSDSPFQKKVMDNFSKKCASIHVGMFSEVSVKALSESILELVRGYSKRVELSENGIELIDGKGLDRLYSDIFINNS